MEKRSWTEAEIIAASDVAIAQTRESLDPKKRPPNFGNQESLHNPDEVQRRLNKDVGFLIMMQKIQNNFNVVSWLADRIMDAEREYGLPLAAKETKEEKDRREAKSAEANMMYAAFADALGIWLDVQKTYQGRVHASQSPTSQPL